MSKKGELFSNSEFDFHRVEIDFEKNDSENKRIEPVITSFKIGFLYECFLDALSRAGEDVLDAYLDSEKPFSCSIRCKDENEKTVFFSGLDPIFSGFQRQKFKGSRPKDSQVIDYNKFIDTTTRSKNSILSHILEDHRLFIFLDSDQQLPDSISNFLSAEVELQCTPAALENAVRKYIANDYQLDDELAQKLMKIPFEMLMTIFSKDRQTSLSHALALAWLEEQGNADNSTDKKSNASEPTLDDLHGLGAAGVWGRDLAQDLADWQQGKISWSDVDRGILLYGAPGTGKTTFAGALARTCGVNFISTSMSQWQAKGHLGDYLKAMRSSFDEARENAPCILFIDEFDSAGDRNAPSDSADYIARAVNGLLECLDGEAKREGVVVIGATNYPNKIDEALRRPGRLDKTVEIPLPDSDAREGILRFHLQGALDGVDLSAVISRTESMSGAWLESLVRDAKRIARRQRRDIEINDLLCALPKRVTVPDDVLARLAVHEAGHTIVARELNRKVEKVVVEREIFLDQKKQSGGFVAVEIPISEKIIRTKTQVIDLVTQLMGGLAAEEIFFGEKSDAGTSDIKESTHHLARMYLSTGQSDYLSFLSEVDAENVSLALHKFPDLHREVEQDLQNCLLKAKDIITLRKGAVSKLADVLVERGKISGDEIEEILKNKGRRIRLRKSLQQSDLIDYSCHSTADYVLN